MGKKAEAGKTLGLRSPQATRRSVSLDEFAELLESSDTLGEVEIVTTRGVYAASVMPPLREHGESPYADYQGLKYVRRFLLEGISLDSVLCEEIGSVGYFSDTRRLILIDTKVNGKVRRMKEPITVVSVCVTEYVFDA
ncbi:hypothetical protein HY312_00590 [Candidatus Saccharibacteria bacterium]|nr:hypothetical protein [Candidatus Saccharibacteria bacterium]